MIRPLAAASSLVLLVLVSGSSVTAAPAPSVTRFADVVGDSSGAADLVDVSVANDRKAVTIEALLPNRSALDADELLVLDLDTDRNEQTGDAGADFSVVFDGWDDTRSVYRWDGSDWAALSADLFDVEYKDGRARAVVPFEQLDGTKPFGFRLLAVKGLNPEVDPVDRAPNAGSWTYAAKLGTPTIARARVRFRPAHPRAGQLFRVRSVSLTLADGTTVSPTSTSCKARLGRRQLRQARRCAWRIPKQARRKKLTVQISVRYRDVGKRLPARSFRVR